MANYTASSVGEILKYVNGSFGGPRAGSGDTLNIANGTYIFNTSGCLYFDMGVTVLASDATIVANGIHGVPRFLGSGNLAQNANTTTVSGLKFNLSNARFLGDSCANQDFHVIDVKANFYNVSVWGPGSGTSENLVSIIATTGQLCHATFYNCTFLSGGNDLIQGSAGGTRSFSNGLFTYSSNEANSNSTIRDSYAKFHNCTFDTCAVRAVGAQQVITSHVGFPVYVYGSKVMGGATAGYGPVSYYFCDITPSGSFTHSDNGQMKSVTVVYGNKIQRVATIEPTVHPTDVLNGIYVRTTMSKPRNYSLVKNNLINFEMATAGTLFQIDPQTNRNFYNHQHIITNNYIVRQSGSTNTGNLIYTMATPSSYHQIIIENNYVQDLRSAILTGISATGTPEARASGFFRIQNNTFVGPTTHALFSINNVDTGNNKWVMIYTNNAASGFSSFHSNGNTVGAVFASGNVTNMSVPSNFAALGVSTKNLFSTRPDFNANRLPIQGGNLDYGSGVTIQGTYSREYTPNDVSSFYPGRTDYIGAFARVSYTGAFPNQVLS